MSRFPAVLLAALVVSPAPAWFDEGPVPPGARVSLELDRTTYFQGENVLIHFVVTNVGQTPFSINLGGDSRGSPRALRFQVQAVDDRGRPAADPNPNPLCLGGLSFSTEIKPGDKHYSTLALMRYRRIDQPGTYKLRVQHDLGWVERDQSKFPAAQGTLTFVQPTPAQARDVVERMAELPVDPSWSDGKKREPYADFTTLLHPVYLPILSPRAARKDANALTALAAMPSPDATRALVRLLVHTDDTFVAEVGRRLASRLPDPALKDGAEDDYQSKRRALVKESWRPEFAAEVCRAGRSLMASNDHGVLASGAYLLCCLGTSEDVPALARGLTTLAQQTRAVKREVNAYPPHRSLAGDLLRAAREMATRGVTVSEQPDSAGELLLFVSAIARREGFRPAGWQAVFARALQHEAPWVREVALQALPVPVPKPLRELLPALFRADHLDVQVAACELAGRANDRTLLGAVLDLLKTTHDDSLLSAAISASVALDGRLERVRALVGRLGENDEVASRCLHALVSAVLADASSYGRSARPDDEAVERCKKAWEVFLKQHADRLQRGKRFSVEDPSVPLTELFPHFTFARPGKP